MFPHFNVSVKISEDGSSSENIFLIKERFNFTAPELANAGNFETYLNFLEVQENIRFVGKNAFAFCPSMRTKNKSRPEQM